MYNDINLAKCIKLKINNQGGLRADTHTGPHRRCNIRNQARFCTGTGWYSRYSPQEVCLNAVCSASPPLVRINVYRNCSKFLQDWIHHTFVQERQ